MKEDQMENPVLRDNVEETVILVRQALLANLDLQDLQDFLESPDSRVKADRLDSRVLSVLPAPQDRQVNLDQMEKVEDRVVLVPQEALARKEQGVNSAHKEHLVTQVQWGPLASQEPRALWVQREKQVPPVFRESLVRGGPREAVDHPANEENLV